MNFDDLLVALWQARARPALADDNLCIADYAMPKETVIVGDERGRFRYNSRGFCGNGYYKHAVALVFARDRHKSSGSYYCVYLFGTICFLMSPK